MNTYTEDLRELQNEYRHRCFMIDYYQKRLDQFDDTIEMLLKCNDSNTFPMYVFENASKYRSIISKNNLKRKKLIDKMDRVCKNRTKALESINKKAIPSIPNRVILSMALICIISPMSMISIMIILLFCEEVGVMIENGRS